MILPMVSTRVSSAIQASSLTYSPCNQHTYLKNHVRHPKPKQKWKTSEARGSSAGKGCVFWVQFQCKWRMQKTATTESHQHQHTSISGNILRTISPAVTIVLKSMDFQVDTSSSPPPQAMKTTKMMDKCCHWWKYNLKKFHRCQWFPSTTKRNHQKNDIQKAIPQKINHQKVHHIHPFTILVPYIRDHSMPQPKPMHYEGNTKKLPYISQLFDFFLPKLGMSLTPSYPTWRIIPVSK